MGSVRGCVYETRPTPGGLDVMLFVQPGGGHCSAPLESGSSDAGWVSGEDDADGRTYLPIVKLQDSAGEEWWR